MKSSLFLDGQDQKFWQSYRKLIDTTRCHTLLHEGVLVSGEKPTSLKKNYFQLYTDHLVRYEDFKEYKTNQAKAQEHAKILFLNTVNINLFELSTSQNYPSDFRYHIQLSQNETQFYICCRDQEEMLIWFEKLKSCCIQSDFQDQYTLIEKIGQGAFAKVFKAQRKIDQAQFAVKIFDKQMVQRNKNREKHIKAIMKEISIMRTLQNPMMIHLYEVFQNEDNLYLVMEYLQGPELFQQLVKFGAYKEKEACQIFKQLLQSISYLNKMNIIHRDIKPENLMFVKKNTFQIKIVDFGLAEYVDDSEALFKRSGTPGYVAPEILKDKPYGSKSDMFSLGVILYQLLTGCTPFFGDNLDQIVEKNTRAEVCYEFQEINLKLSNQSVDLMKSLLKPNPEHRFSADKALQHLWLSLQPYQENKFMTNASSRFSGTTYTPRYSQRRDQSVKVLDEKLIRTTEKRNSFHMKPQSEKCSPIMKKSYAIMQQSPNYLQKKSKISEFLSNNSDRDTLDTINESPQKPKLSPILPASFVRINKQKIINI